MKPRAIDKDAAFKSAGEDSGASSAGEDFTQLTFTGLPMSNPDLSDITTPTPTETAVVLKVNRSLPCDSILPKATFTSDTTEKGDDASVTPDHASLSKTWSASAFTGAQLRGTCSLEYAEHMKDKSHRRKAHMVDLRKDDVQHPQLPPPSSMTSTSKHAISTCLTRYSTHALTMINTKGALARSLAHFYSFFSSLLHSHYYSLREQRHAVSNK